MTIMVKKVNEVFFELGLERSQALELKQALSYYAPNYKFHPMYKSGMWDGKIFFFNTTDRLLPIGLLPDFIKFCKSSGYSYHLDFDASEEFSNSITEDFMDRFYDIVFPPECGFYPRDYQQEAIYSALNNLRGVTLASVGSGKSIMIYSAVRYLLAMRKKILIMVPSVSLVEQMYSDFREYGWDNLEQHVVRLYSGEGRGEEFKNREYDVLISTWQSIVKKPQRFFEQFDGLIVDETHGVRGKSMSDVCKMCVNAKYRLGYTGTLPSEPAEKATVKAFLGPVTYEIKSKELIDRGVLSKIKINNLIMRYPEIFRKKRTGYQEEIADINNYSERNSALDYIMTNTTPGQNTLILVSRIDHLDSVKKYLTTHYKGHSVYDIYGDTLASRREEIRKKIDKEGNVILVATFNTMSTGVNIKKLHHVVFFASYKSEIKVIQSIGRGLRTHETKENMVLWDCVDDMRYTEGRRTIKNYCYTHWEQRKEYYEEQQFEYIDISITI